MPRGRPRRHPVAGQDAAFQNPNAAPAEAATTAIPSGLAPGGEATEAPRNIARAARAADIRGDDEPAPRPRKKGGMTAEESRELAKKRAAEILEHDIGDEDDDKYYIPPHYQPDGWKYLWRRTSVYGKEDPQYQVKLAQTGWTAVPADRHPDMMPSTGGPYETIDRDGMRLMEIPTEVYNLLAAKEHRKAIEQVRVKTAQLNQAPPGTFARDEHAQTTPKVRRGYEPLIVPDA